MDSKANTPNTPNNLEQIISLQNQIIELNKKNNKLYSSYQSTVHITISFIVLILLLLWYLKPNDNKNI